MSWERLDHKPGMTPEQVAEQRRLNGLFARVFGSADGLEVLALLRSSTIEKPISPDASHSALVHLEGQRQLVRVIETRVANGRDQHPSELRREYPALRRAAE